MLKHQRNAGGGELPSVARGGVDAGLPHGFRRCVANTHSLRKPYTNTVGAGRLVANFLSPTVNKRLKWEYRRCRI
jgi:hypothetical protein